MSYVSITKELAEFLGIDPTAMYLRITLFNEINKYIVDHHCSEDSSPMICPNEPLIRLLRLTGEDQVTFAYIHLLEKMECHLTEVAGAKVPKMNHIIAIREPDDRVHRTQLAGFQDGMTIYVIHHKTYENTNVFTTDKDQVDDIVKQLVLEHEGTEGQWYCRKLIEHRKFEADMDM